MNIRFVNNSFIRNQVNNFNKKISFGEIDDFDSSYSSKKISESDYWYEKDIIEEKYTKLRQYYYRSGLSASEKEKLIDKLERAKQHELDDLKSNY